MSLKTEDNPKQSEPQNSPDNNVLKPNDYELNKMNFNNALISDKRTYFQYYLSLLKSKHLLLSVIIPSND